MANQPARVRTLHWGSFRAVGHNGTGLSFTAPASDTLVSVLNELPATGEHRERRIFLDHSSSSTTSGGAHGSRRQASVPEAKIAGVELHFDTRAGNKVEIFLAVPLEPNPPRCTWVKSA